MSRRHGSDLNPEALNPQSLRIPEHACERLATFARRLSTPDAEVSAAEATRGICLLALHVALGAAGTDAAEAFRIAARDPALPGVREGLNAFTSLLDGEPSTIPIRVDEGGPHARPGERAHRQQRARQPLRNQALRLPQPARDDLEALAKGLCAGGANVKAGEVMRGLCLLALEIVEGAAGAEVANAFCVAAIDATSEGTRRAIRELQLLLDGEPSTMPDPPVGDGATPPGESSPASTIPTSHAA